MHIDLLRGQEHLRGEFMMKINLKFGQKQESVQTGLQVKTLVRAGECDCLRMPDGGWWCSDNKGNKKMVWDVSEMQNWMSSCNE